MHGRQRGAAERLTPYQIEPGGQWKAGVLDGAAEGDEGGSELVAHVEVVSCRNLGGLIPEPEAVVALMEADPVPKCTQ